jgi:serine protease AprX
MFGMMRKCARFIALFAVAFLILNFAAPAMALNEVADVIHVRDLWTAEWTASNGTVMHGVTGKGVGVAIIDTGIDGTHPDFMGRIVYNAKYIPEIGWIEMIDTDINQNYVSMAHGTFCAGEIGGSGVNSNGLYRGIAPECNLIGLSVDNIVFPVQQFQEIADEWIYENSEKYNIRVVSNSYSDGGTDFSTELRSVVEKSILYVYCAGNGGGNGSDNNMVNTCNPLGIMTVGGCRKDGKTMWSGSSRGYKYNQSTWPSITAPSCLIVSTLAKSAIVVPYIFFYPEDAELALKGYIRESGNGTSFSNPLVAGVAALIFQVNPTLKPAQAKQIIELTADQNFGPYNETGWFSGHGLVNGTRAVAVAHYMALRPNATIDETLRYYRIRQNGDHIVFNPLPLPEIQKDDSGDTTVQRQKQFIPGFECVFLILAICAILIISKKRR